MIVYEIPVKQIDEGKVEKPNLSNQEVLMVTLAYETENRKSYRLVQIRFERVVFNENGICDFKEEHLSDKNRVLLEYAMSGISTGESQPLPIPPAPIIPSEKEIQSIKSYLNRKYPLLLKNSPDAINDSIRKSKKVHEENIKKLKESHRVTK